MIKRVAVTGATGFIGNVLVRKLVRLGYQVKALVYNNERALDGVNVEKIKGSINDKKALATLCQDCSTVFHLASYISIFKHDIPKLKHINIEGTQNVMDICSELKIKLVYASSAEAIGKKGDFDHTEKDGFNPNKSLIPYGWSKAVASNAVLAHKNLNAVIVCPSGVIGPYDFNTSLLGKMVIQFLLKKLPAYPRSGGFCYVDVRDVANALIAAHEKAKNGSVYIVSGPYLSMEEMMNLIEEVSEVPKPRMRISLGLLKFYGGLVEPFNKLFRKKSLFTSGTANVLASELHVRSLHLQRDLGVSIRSLKKSFYDMVRFYRGEDVELS